MEQGVGGSP